MLEYTLELHSSHSRRYSSSDHLPFIPCLRDFNWWSLNNYLPLLEHVNRLGWNPKPNIWFWALVPTIIIIYGNFRHYIRICFNFFIIHEKLLVRILVKWVCKLLIMYYSLLIRKEGRSSLLNYSINMLSFHFTN